MNDTQRRTKIKAMIEQETRDVAATDYTSYMDKVLFACSILKQVGEAGQLNEMPRQQLLDMIDAIGSTMTFNRELLVEIKKLVHLKQQDQEEQEPET